MPTVSGKILSVDEETKLLQPIDSYVNEIQKKVDALRATVPRVSSSCRAALMPLRATACLPKQSAMSHQWL